MRSSPSFSLSLYAGADGPSRCVLFWGSARSLGGGARRLLAAKIQDEMKALQLCQTKVRQKKLPMEVIDAEYQW